MTKISAFLKRYSWFFLVVGFGVPIWTSLSEEPLPAFVLVIGIFSMLLALVGLRLFDSDKDKEEYWRSRK